MPLRSAGLLLGEVPGAGQRAKELKDGWTLVTGDGSYVAQHEHTIMVTEKEPLILTAANEI